jgi:D-hydroxyproline dehydrogenase subunit gamma
MAGLFHRVGELARNQVHLIVDGEPVTALEGDTLLAALLTRGCRLRQSEFGGDARAGFCLMGACQECWVWTAAGERMRACSTPVRDGLNIVTAGTAWSLIP